VAIAASQNNNKTDMKNYILITFLLFFYIAKAQVFVNPSFENWGSNTCAGNTPPDYWLDYSNGLTLGVDECNFSTCSSTIPPNASNGTVYARAYSKNSSTGEGLCQYVSGFNVGSKYHISFDYAGSNLIICFAHNQWHVFIDDIDVAQTPEFLSNDSLWTTFQFSFTATNQIHKVGFRAYTIGEVESGSAAIDNLTIALDPLSNSTFTSKILFNIYPNPFTTRTTLKLNSILQDGTVAIYNSYGQQIRKIKHIHDSVVVIEKDNLTPGIYLLQLTDGDSKTVTRKLILKE